MPDVSYYYRILEIEVGASAETVKEAYRDLAQVWHPDRFTNSPRLQQKAQDKMKVINEAYEYLKAHGSLADRQPAQPAPPKPEPPPYSQSAPRPSASDRFNYSQGSDELWCLRGHTALVSSVGFSPNGKLLVSGGYDKTVRVWQTGTGLEKLWFLGHKSAVTAVGFAPDNRGAYSCGMDKSVFLRDCETRKEIQYFYAGAVVQCAAISPDGRYLITGTVGAGTILWEVATGRELRRYNVDGFVSSVRFSPRGDRLAIATGDGDVSLYDRSQSVPTQNIKISHGGTGQLVESVRFTRDGSYLITARNNQIQLWNADTGRESGRIETGASAVCCAEVTPDDSRFVTGHTDGSVRLWGGMNGSELHVYKGHSESVKSIAVSNDGTLIASGSCDKTIRIWRLNAGA